MISVIIPTYRNAAYLDLCVTSILEHQDNKNEIIVIVDGFYEESKYVLDKFDGKITIVEFDENKGMQMAINAGVYCATNEQIFIVNDDNVFPPHWDTRLESQYHENTIFTVNQIEPTGPSMFQFPIVDCGKTLKEFDMAKFIESEQSLQSNNITKDGNIFPFLINKKWFMAVGGFDTFYNSPNWCDVDFFMKLELIPIVGYARLHNLHLYHFGSVSTKKNAESQSFIEREKFAIEQYEFKWGCVPSIGLNAVHYHNTKLPKDGQSFRGFVV